MALDHNLINSEICLYAYPTWTARITRKLPQNKQNTSTTYFITLTQSRCWLFIWDSIPCGVTASSKDGESSTSLWSESGKERREGVKVRVRFRLREEAETGVEVASVWTPLRWDRLFWGLRGLAWGVGTKEEGFEAESWDRWRSSVVNFDLEWKQKIFEPHEERLLRRDLADSSPSLFI